jgi:iron complex outermembrane receptor protein
MNKTLLSLAAIATLTTSSLAEDNNISNGITLQILEVSSSAIKTDELRSTDAVEVYTSEEIEKAHVQNVYEFLNQQTSVVTMPTGGDGANAGVINITTKKNNDREITVYGGTYINNDGVTGIVDGPYGTQDASFYAGYADDLMSVSATGEYQKNDGMRDLTITGPKDETKLQTGSIDLTLTPIEALELRLSGSSTRANINYAGSLTLQQYEENPFQAGNSYTEQDYDTDVVSAGMSYFITDALSLNFDANHEKKSSDNTSVWFGTAYPFAANYVYDSLTATLDYNNDIVALSLGVNGFSGDRNSDATSYSIASTTTKENLAAFVMTEWYIGNSTLKAGYRYEQVNYKFEDALQLSEDKHDLQGAEAGYNYRFSDTQSLFGNFAHSYQAPDVDRFFTYGAFNEFIDPMQANNYTLGYNNIQATNKFKVSAYYIDLKNEIYYYKDLVNSYPSPSLSVNTNIDKSHKYGLDIYDKWLITPSFNVVFNYNYVQAIIDEEIGRNGEDYAGKKLPGVSNHNVKATLSYLPNEFTTFAITETYRSEAYAMNDFNNDFSQKQDPYMSTDISATYTKDNYELFAKINNLFNQKNGLWIQDDAIYPVNFATSGIVGFKLKY